MATSKTYFGLRHGSTKSHTYSVVNGKQVTKDRVEEATPTFAAAIATYPVGQERFLNGSDVDVAGTASSSSSSSSGTETGGDDNTGDQLP